MFLSGFPSPSTIQPTTEADEKPSPVQTHEKERSESTWQPSGINSADTVSLKLESASAQPLFSVSQSELPKVQHDVASTEIDLLDSMSFSPSLRSQRLNTSLNFSPQLAATEDFGDSWGSAVAASSSADTVDVKSCGEKDSSQGIRSSSPAVNSQGTCPGNVCDQPVCDPTSLYASVVSSSSSASALSRSPANSAGGKSPVNLDSPPTSRLGNGVGRGMSIMALLKKPKASVSSSSSESTIAESRSPGEPQKVSQSTEEPQSTNLEQVPKQTAFLATLDKDLDSHVEPANQSCLENGQQVVDENLTTHKSSDLRKDPEVAVSADVARNDATATRAVVENVADIYVSSAETKPKLPIQSSPSSVSSPQESFSISSPSNQTVQTTLVMQSQGEEIVRDHTPLPSESPGPLERSAGSSTDVSLNSEGLDQSSSSRMLTKRLPRIARQSGSRTGTSVPPSTQKSLPSRPSYSPSSVHSPPAGQNASPESVRHGIEDTDCVPEIHREPVADGNTMPADDRYFVYLFV